MEDLKAKSTSEAARVAVQEVDEERPTMRSVAVLGGPSALPPLSFGGLPPLKLSKAPLPSLQKSANCEPSLNVQQEWNASSWKVQVDDIEMVPEDFPLERTHRMIHGVGPTEVAQRISEALRQESIQADFGPCKVKCRTQDCVSFRIRLYSGGENCEPVVVEVQRRSGSVSAFMTTCRLVLAAAEGQDPRTVKPSLMSRKPFMPVGQMKCLQKPMLAAPLGPSDCESALASAAAMFRSSRKDEVALGLENLCSLIDPLKTSPMVAQHAAVSFLRDEQDLREEVRLMADRDVFLEPHEGTHADNMHHLALRVMANALSLCSKENCLESIISNDKAWFVESLLPCLLSDIQVATSHACHACAAAACMSSLLACSDSMRQIIQQEGGADALQKAQVYGQARHELLAQETTRCLKFL